MTHRIFVRDLVAKIVGLCLTHDVFYAARNSRNGQVKWLPYSVVGLLDTEPQRNKSNRGKFVPGAGVNWSLELNLGEVAEELDRIRNDWRDHGDGRGWVFHLIYERLNRARISKLLVGKSLSAVLNTINDDTTYMAESRKGDFAKDIPDEKCASKIKDGKPDGSLRGGGPELWELLSVFTGCGLASNERHLERMDAETARHIDPNNRDLLKNSFRGLSADEGNVFVTPAPDTLILRVACAFGFGRGGLTDKPGDPSFEDLMVASWQGEWKHAEARKAVWDLFAGQRYKDGSFGGTVDEFLKTYFEFALSSDVLPLAPSTGGKEKETPYPAEALDGSETDAAKRLVLEPVPASPLEPVAISLELKQETLVCFDVKAGNEEDFGTFSFQRVWIVCDLAEGPDRDRMSVVKDGTIEVPGHGRIKMGIKRNDRRYLTVELIAEDEATLPTTFLFPDLYELFNVVSPKAEQAITASLLGRMSEISGKFAPGTDNGQDTLLERVLATHKWAERAGQTPKDWIDNPDEQRTVLTERFEFKERRL